MKSLIIALTILIMSGPVFGTYMLMTNGDHDIENITVLQFEVVEFSIFTSEPGDGDYVHWIVIAWTDVWLGELTEPIILPAAGSGASVIPWFRRTPEGNVNYEGWTVSTGQDRTAGVQFQSSYDCSQFENTVTVHLLGGTFPVYHVLDTVTIHQFIPEPATVGILGLGALCLLKMRK